MYLDLIEDPWSLTDHTISLSDYSGSATTLEVDGRRDPRIICAQNIAPWFRTRRNLLPQASFPFRSHGEILSFYYLPTPSKEKQDTDFKISLGLLNDTYFVIQKNSIQRYSEEMSDNSLEAEVNAWINWCIRLFLEIAEANEKNEDTFNGISRSSWGKVIRHIVRDGEEEAPMSLIVQLTNNTRLRNILLSISRNPRKILERIRQNMKISRIQQMDGACIRAYARRPGYDLATKAGAKQELLGLNRMENTDTLENKVYLWVLNTIEKFARKYIRENRQFSASERVIGVRKFASEAVSMKKATQIQSVSFESLVHPIQPNYPLQLDLRYKEVYKTYLRLRHDEKVYDDAWEWQRVLWGCSARMVLYSTFLKSLKTFYSNFIYVRNEGQQGRWLNQSDAPGPFILNKRSFYLVDAWDLTCPEEWLDQKELFPGAHDIGRLGCDAVFFSQTQKKILLIWFAFDTTGSNVLHSERLETCLDAIKHFQRDLKRQNKYLNSLDGLIFTSNFQADAHIEFRSLITPDNPKMYLLSVPARSYRVMEHLEANVQKIIAEVTV